ncbi:MAG: DUF1810 domain-containing protein [Rubrivivax sp.]
MKSVDGAGNDPWQLRRFVAAQDAVYAQVLAELSAGAKTSHWIWFVFPQLRALGRSNTARHYGIASRDEALAYWKHPLLAARLRRCCAALLALHERSAVMVLGEVDALKLCSSMTLFNAVAHRDEICFGAVLDRFFAGEQDAATLALL